MRSNTDTFSVTILYHIYKQENGVYAGYDSLCIISLFSMYAISVIMRKNLCIATIHTNASLKESPPTKMVENISMIFVTLNKTT